MSKQPSTGLLWVIGIALILLGVVYFSINPQTKNLTIGVVAPLSGDLEMYGAQMQNAYDLALSEINDAGGILGKTVELVYKDGACSGDQATIATNELLESGEVSFVVGGGCLLESDTIRAVTEPAETLFVSATTLRATETDSPLSFSTHPSAKQEVQILAEHGFESGHRRAVVLYQQSELADLLRNEFEEVYEGDVIFSGSFETQDDLDGMVSSIRSASPQMVLIIPSEAEAGAMAIDTLNSNWFNVGVYATDGVVDAEAFAETPSLFEELVISDVRVADSEAAQHFLEAYKTTYGTTPNLPMIAAAAYDGLTLLAEALSSTTGDPTAAAEYLSTQVNAYSGATGTFSFDENGNTDLEPVLVQVTAGEMIEIETEEAE